MIFIKVLEEFYNIFGPELKAVTGDPKRIEDVLKRVNALVVPIENVSIAGHKCYYYVHCLGKYFITCVLRYIKNEIEK